MAGVSRGSEKGEPCGFQAVWGDPLQGILMFLIIRYYPHVGCPLQIKLASPMHTPACACTHVHTHTHQRTYTSSSLPFAASPSLLLKTGFILKMHFFAGLLLLLNTEISLFLPASHPVSLRVTVTVSCSCLFSLALQQPPTLLPMVR